MVNIATLKLSYIAGQYRLHLPKAFVEDSAFPFKPGEELTMKIQEGRVVMEKAMKE